MNTPGNPALWLDQANAMFKAWSDQQQAALRAWTSPAGAATSASAASSPAPPGLDSMFGMAEAMWTESMQRWGAIVQQALPASGIEELFKVMFDPKKWPELGVSPLDRAIEHLVEGPSYATLWTLDRKLLKAQKLRLEWSRDLATYQAVLHSAWSEALRRFFTEIQKEGEPITTWRALIDVWVDVANATLIDAHRRPEFLDAQRALTRSSTECRLAERELAESWCELHHIPTRTEIDDLARSVHELRREVRLLARREADSIAPPRAGPTRASDSGALATSAAPPATRATP